MTYHFCVVIGAAEHQWYFAYFKLFKKLNKQKNRNKEKYKNQNRKQANHISLSCGTLT